MNWPVKVWKIMPQLKAIKRNISLSIFKVGLLKNNAELTRKRQRSRSRNFGYALGGKFEGLLHENKKSGSN